MENLNMILIGVIVLLFVVIVVLFMTRPKCMCEHSMCTLDVSSEEVKSFFKTYSSTPGFNLPLGLTVDQVNEVLNSPSIILPQSVPMLSSISKLSQAELFVLDMGIMILLGKAGFSADQIKSLTPEQIKNLTPFEVVGTLTLIMNNVIQNPFSTEQLNALLQMSASS